MINVTGIQTSFFCSYIRPVWRYARGKAIILDYAAVKDRNQHNYLI
jgi:hypothetical protein